MISCPHSIYFFRGSVDNFGCIENYHGEKTEEELKETNTPLLDRSNEGSYYRSHDSFDVKGNPNFQVSLLSPSYQIQAGAYLCVKYNEFQQRCMFVCLGDNIVNTLHDWHIVPLERPVVAPPEQKIHTIEIPGANGILDLSNSMTKYPTFGNRTGSFKFAVINSETDTNTAYTKMLRFLQGTNVKMVLEDDPLYFYEGRVFVEGVEPKADGTWSEFTIGYDVYPYRKSIYTSLDEWLWNPFNFETDVIQNSLFDNIEISSPNSWTTKNLKGMIDMMPVIPEITVTQQILCRLTNSDLGISEKQFVLSPNKKVYTDLILSEFTQESVLLLSFKGSAYVTIKFRSGRL